MNQTTWHWPDHVIGKRESRRLREEHNALANSHAELLAALQSILKWVDPYSVPGYEDKVRDVEAAEAAVAKAEEVGHE